MSKIQNNENIKNLNHFKALFGEEGLRIMVEEFPGVVIRFPSSLEYDKEERNKKIVDEARSTNYKDMGVMELAKELANQYGLSQSHILKIINDHKNR